MADVGKTPHRLVALKAADEMPRLLGQDNQLGNTPFSIGSATKLPSFGDGDKASPERKGLPGLAPMAIIAMGGGETLHHELPISTFHVPELKSVRVSRSCFGGMYSGKPRREVRAVLDLERTKTIRALAD